MISTTNKKKWSKKEKKEWYEYCENVSVLTDLMIYYRRFVNRKISEKMIGSAVDWEVRVVHKWQNRFLPIYHKIPGDNYDNNILFICNKK